VENGGIQKKLSLRVSSSIRDANPVPNRIGFPPSTAFSNLAKLQDQQTGDTIIRLGDLATLRLVGFPLAKLASTDFLF